MMLNSAITSSTQSYLYSGNWILSTEFSFLETVIGEKEPGYKIDPMQLQDGVISVPPTEAWDQLSQSLCA
ncbi:hypothetical protein TNCV_1109931 [Trichonephila clavipes]|nr:hypothetical protein TNCV_1109931 [Trichonephila clavipes]